MSIRIAGVVVKKRMLSTLVIPSLITVFGAAWLATDKIKWIGRYAPLIEIKSPSKPAK